MLRGPMSSPLGQLEQIEGTVDSAFAGAADAQQLLFVQAQFLGREGSVNALMKQIPTLPATERRAFGQRINALKERIQSAFESAQARMDRAALDKELSGQPLDVTLPGRRRAVGRLHPVLRVLGELVEVFVGFGFDIAEGPELELAEFNFEKLGFPPDHPAMDMHDTFYIAGENGRRLLRTHTSPVQIREMLSHAPPVMVVAPGVVYRRDDDATHSPMFMQLEGLVVDTNVSMGDLKGLFEAFSQRMFGPNAKTRFRASYFPFTEPSAEMDVACLTCGAADPTCRKCRGKGWTEVLGCGMVHPAVLENVGYDPEKYTGLAFGIGIDRTAAVRFGVPDLRLFYENDVRFLQSL